MCVEESRIIRDASRLPAYIEQRFGKPSLFPVTPCDLEHYAGNSSFSDYPILWLKMQLYRQGYFATKLPLDEEFPELFYTDERGKVHLLHVHFARSKVFTTYRIPEPIDLTAARVSVNPYSDCFPFNPEIDN